MVLAWFFSSLIYLSPADTHPAPIQVIAIDASSRNQANELIAALQSLNATTKSSLLTAAADSPTVDPLVNAESSLRRAQQAYARLQTREALDHLQQAIASLMPQNTRNDAKKLLAQAFRLVALIHTYLGNNAEATTNFSSAYFLEPDFSPALEEWPPNSRLHYADTVATLKRSAGVTVSLRPEPPTTAVWLDGNFLGLGARTLNNLTPGVHTVVLQHTGYQTLATLLPITDTTVAEIPLYLQPTADSQGVTALPNTNDLQANHESWVFRQLAFLTQAGFFVLLHSTATQTIAIRIFSTNGEQLGNEFSFNDPSSTAATIVSRIQILEQQSTTTTVADKPWYTSWVPWTIAAGVLIAAGTGTALVLARDRKERVVFILGPR